MLPHSAHNGGVFVDSDVDSVGDEYDVLLPSVHNGDVYVVNQAGRDVHSVLLVWHVVRWSGVMWKT